MSFLGKKNLFQRCNNKNLSFFLVCEVGVYLPETSNILDFIEDDVKTILVEPDKESLSRIYKYFGNKKNIEIYPYAVYDYNGKLELIQRSASTFVRDLPKSPALVNDNYTIDNKDTFEVECKEFNDIDPGNIELLSVDTEGCEWFVLKNLASRPKVISLETHGKYYTNPFINEIKEWLDRNDYSIWYKTRSDSVYFLKGSLNIGVIENIELLFMNVLINFRKLKKFIRK
jgi:FkbM family methyltransferase